MERENSNKTKLYLLNLANKARGKGLIFIIWFNISYLEKQLHDFTLLKEKVETCKLIYKLIESICSGDRQNEEIAYGLFDKFKFHVRFWVVLLLIYLG